MAAKILYRFGSIGKFVQAPDDDLRLSIPGDARWADMFITVRRLMTVGMRETLVRTRLGEDHEALCAYLLMTMQHLPEERMIAIFADREGLVIAEEVIAEGLEGYVVLTPRRIFGRALKLDARKILLAHNHPSGSAQPSKLDIEHTRRLHEQALGLGMTIEDHLIIGARAVTSMKARGLF